MEITKKIINQIRITSSGNLEGILCDVENFKKGDLLYLPNMHVDYMNKVMSSKGVVAKIGGICAHMSIVCRELSIPALVYSKANELIGKYLLLDSDKKELYVYNQS